MKKLGVVAAIACAAFCANYVRHLYQRDQELTKSIIKVKESLRSAAGDVYSCINTLQLKKESKHQSMMENNLQWAKKEWDKF